MKRVLAPANGICVLLALALFALYHGNGLAFLFWNDSPGYLLQAQSIAGAEPYARPSGRNVGYPLLLALSLSLPAPAFSLIVLQFVIIGACLLLIWLSVSKVAPALSGAHPAVVAAVTRGLPLGLTATLAYSGLHILALSMLTEILFAALALVAVVATAKFVASPHGTPRPVLRAAAASAAVALPLLVKPHWLLAAALLGFVIAIRLAAFWRPLAASSARSWLHASGALLLAFATIALVTWPDRYLAKTVNHADSALFGPRTVFCNNMHLSMRAARASPTFRLHADQRVHAAIFQHLQVIERRYRGGWKRLGFNGDLCSFDPDLHRTVAKLLPKINDQVAFYIGATARTAMARPVDFTIRVLRQMLFGVTSAFEKYAGHYPLALFENVAAATGHALNLPQDFHWGLRRTHDAGPFGSRTYMDATLLGQFVNAMLAATFTLLTVAYAILILATIALPWRLFRAWPVDRQRAFFAWLVVPLAAVLGHNLLVAVTHSFDIWRYGFNLFFVNILLVAAAAVFWMSEYVYRRVGRSAGIIGRARNVRSSN